MAGFFEIPCLQGIVASNQIGLQKNDSLLEDKTLICQIFELTLHPGKGQQPSLLQRFSNFQV